MASNVRALVLGKALPPAATAQLTGWLVGNKTGDARIRAGLPAGWRVGDKTGGGATADNTVVGRRPDRRQGAAPERLSR